jgi:hypothetical protein
VPLESTIACNAGFSCGVSAVTVLSSTPLVQDCCTTSVSLNSALEFLSATSCLVYTSCVDFSVAVTSDPDILTWYNFLISFLLWMTGIK